MTLLKSTNAVNEVPPPAKKLPPILEGWLSTCAGVLTILYLHDIVPLGSRPIQEILIHTGMDAVPRGYRRLLAKLNALVVHDILEVHWIQGVKRFQLSPAGIARIPAARIHARKLRDLLSCHVGD